MFLISVFPSNKLPNTLKAILSTPKKLLDLAKPSCSAQRKRNKSSAVDDFPLGLLLCDQFTSNSRRHDLHLKIPE